MGGRPVVVPSVGLFHGVHEQRVHREARDALRADDQHHVVLGGEVALVAQLRGDVEGQARNVPTAASLLL